MAMQSTTPEWERMTAEERADHLFGQLDALFALVSAAIETHPDPQALALHYFGGRELQTAQILTLQASEKVLEGRKMSELRIEAFLRSRGVNVPPG